MRSSNGVGQPRLKNMSRGESLVIVMASALAVFGTLIQACLASTEGQAALGKGTVWVDKMHLASWVALLFGAILLLVNAL